MAADSAIASTWPPIPYRLADVTLKVERIHGHGQPRQELTLFGGDRATLDQQPGVRTVAVPQADVLRAVEGLYTMRFFDLAPEIGPRQSVFLKPDGVVGLQLRRRSDVTTTRVCMAVTDYEKCVRMIEGDGPRELEDWVQTLFADMLQRFATVKK